MTTDQITPLVRADDSILNPFPMYAQMRTNAPVVYHEEQKLWLVYGYEDIRTILSDPATFSSQILGDGPEAEIHQTLSSTDPPYHTKLRNLISRAFTPKAIADLEPRMEQVVHQLLDRVIET